MERDRNTAFMVVFYASLIPVLLYGAGPESFDWRGIWLFFAIIGFCAFDQLTTEQSPLSR